ncbi:hypothetical protein GW17_00003973 [Ensete ventricosum]|nr:hypothetical protein GW17_00003973 [Ensete ventricosum]
MKPTSRFRICSSSCSLRRPQRSGYLGGDLGLGATTTTGGASSGGAVGTVSPIVTRGRTRAQTELRSPQKDSKGMPSKGITRGGGGEETWTASAADRWRCIVAEGGGAMHRKGRAVLQTARDAHRHVGRTAESSPSTLFPPSLPLQTSTSTIVLLWNACFPFSSNYFFQRRKLFDVSVADEVTAILGSDTQSVAISSSLPAAERKQRGAATKWNGHLWPALLHPLFAAPELEHGRFVPGARGHVTVHPTFPRATPAGAGPAFFLHSRPRSPPRQRGLPRRAAPRTPRRVTMTYDRTWGRVHRTRDQRADCTTRAPPLVACRGGIASLAAARVP